jgi:hypothetical protein
MRLGTFGRGEDVAVADLTNQRDRYPLTLPPDSVSQPAGHRETLAPRTHGLVGASQSVGQCVLDKGVGDHPVDQSEVVGHEASAGRRGGGSCPVAFGNAVVYRLRAYDIANKALAGVSAPFEVVGSDPPTTCPAPASYH